MALTVVDNRSILDECDATGGWTATDGPATFTTAPTPIESTACLAMQVSNTNEDAYTSITSDDYSGGGTLSIWMSDRASFDTTANGGIAIVVGDGTNRIAYHLGGSDGAAFRHEVGPVKWSCFVLDLANKPANFTALAGSEASLNEAAITQVGVYFLTVAKSVGGSDNCFWDIIRWADNGVGIEVYGGTSGSRESLATLAAADRGTGNQEAYGILRQLSTGVYGVQGNINLGDPTSTNATYIDIDTETITWEDRGLSANNYYRFACAGNGTGVTEIRILNSTLSVAGAASASFNTDDANLDAMECTGSTFINFGDGIETGDINQDWTTCKFIDCGQIIVNGADLSGSTVDGYEGTADTASLVWDVNQNPGGELDNIEFTMGTALTHAIEFTTNSSLTITLAGQTFTGYDTTNGNTTANDAVLLFADRGSDSVWNVSASGVTGTISYKKARAGDTVNITNTVDVTFTGLRDNTEIRIYSAGTTTELDGIEDATTGTTDNRSFTASIAAGTSVDYRIHNVTYVTQEVYAFPWPSSNQSLPVQQQFDRVYLNP